MLDPILKNFDDHVENFIRFLRERLNCRLDYMGPDDIQQHILQKSTYACSVYCGPKKVLKDVFPIMIGSRLDLAIRHGGVRTFEEPPSPPASVPFGTVDIGRGFFIIGGFLRHLPYFYTNDPTNTHMIQKKIVRVYSYNAQDRGKELSFYVADANGRRFGDAVIVHNDGSESSDDPAFFTHCPYPVDLTAYMRHIYREESFDIDHLRNKMYISPGHLFTKLFIKYLYEPLRNQDWKTLKARLLLVRKSIESGCVLHVLSRKTVYFKEGKSAGKMTQEQQQESHREIGANGEVFIEKNTGCYREVSSQSYPLNPFMLYLIVRQMSNKVNHSTLDPYHPSQEGWFCKLGVFDTKNVGRTNTMVRSVVVSSYDHLDPVYHDSPNAEFWNFLNLEPEPGSPYYVVVNEACIPVSRRSHLRINLKSLKYTFGKIECYPESNFIIIRYKMGLIMKELPLTNGIFVTPGDEMYWIRRIYHIESKAEFVKRWNEYSYIVDLNCAFSHNAFLKNILAFNALKNAVLATTSLYALYFMDSVSTYRRSPTPDHRPLMDPVRDGISPHFSLLLPQPVVAYMSFRGMTQEDCIVKREGFDAFDCVRFHTLRLRMNVQDSDTWIRFYPVNGDTDPESQLLGTLVAGSPLKVEPYSIHVTAKRGKSDCEYHLFFSKTPFRVIKYHVSDDKLMISVEQEHVSSTGDKLCSMHGQKGVIRVVKNVPLLNGSVRPDLILNPYCIVGRLTLGQMLEAVRIGGGRDTSLVHNARNKLMVGSRAFYGRTFYFAVVYFSCEHMYAPDVWVMDKVLSQPVKGRSRQGGMKLGNMEVNALRGCGVASCFESKVFEDGDRVPVENCPTESIPQAIELVKHDFAHYKINLQWQSSPTIQLL